MRAIVSSTSPLLLALALLGTTSCGGSSGGGGGGGDPPPPPTVMLDAVTGNRHFYVGDTLEVTYTADGATNAQVFVVLDQDGNVLTTGDQVVVDTAPIAPGGQVVRIVTIPGGVPPAGYTLFVVVDDGQNPPATAPDVGVTYVQLPISLTGVRPPGSSNRYGVLGSEVYFGRSELEDGNAGFLNSDGLDDADLVIARYDAAAATFTQGSFSTERTSVNAGVSQILPTGDGSLVAWVTLEADQNVDSDGDGGQTDRMISTWIPGAAGPVNNTLCGLDRIHTVLVQRVAASFLEAQHGPGGTDHVGDGDQTDTVQGYLDANAPPPPNASQYAFWPLPASNNAFRTEPGLQAAYFASEAGFAPGTDFNLDGDLLDHMLVRGDFSAPGGLPATILGIAGIPTPRAVDSTAGFDVASAGPWLGYYVDENASAGADVNGDGTTGYVPAFTDFTAGVEHLLPAPSPGTMNTAAGNPTLLFDSNRMFFTMQEGGRVEGQPGTNNDTDAGLDQNILCWTDPSLGAGAVTIPLNVSGGTGMGTLLALSLDGGALARLAPGWLGLSVQEGANGNTDINGNGSVDAAFLLVETGLMAGPAIHNPALVHTPAGNIPATGLGSSQGVILRLLEVVSGTDLNGDADTIDTLLAFLPFGTPTAPVILDAGGNHAFQAGSLLGVTANELFTQTDYDGNGVATDSVFRVFDLTGVVLHEGTLSFPQSVPAADLSGGTWAFLRSEEAENRDLNEDGDQTDALIGIFSP